LKELRGKTVARKSSIGGPRDCAGGLDIDNSINTPLISSVSYFSLGAKPTKDPVVTGLLRGLSHDPVYRFLQ